MNYFGRAESAANAILEAFRAGAIPAALKTVFLNPKDGRPCALWSWSNQVLAAIFGQGDARGFQQWKQVNRSVRKGEKAFYILVPIVKECETTNEAGQREKRRAVVGFTSAAVFGVQQTEGEPLKADESTAAFLDALPFVDVARAWGLKVSAARAHEGGALGLYRHGQAIVVGVENPVVWAHELIHAADDRLGGLTEKGQHWRSETVAQLGACVLLNCLGQTVDADPGFTWKYISGYCQREGKDPVAACMQVLKRTCDAVNLIFSEAERLQGKPVAACFRAVDEVAA
ncbi:MAG: hypothetical protein KIS92_20110 [Planctomycetota bacterium]|nr:hypothetical protein [Planctomycetota bacterium]